MPGEKRPAGLVPQRDDSREKLTNAHSSCDKCKTKVSQGHKFCHSCAYKADSKSRSPEEPSRKPQHTPR